MTDDDIEQMWSAARNETESAVVAADAAPLESVDTLLDHVTLDRPEPGAVDEPPDTAEPDRTEVDTETGTDDDADDDEVWP